MHCAQCLWNDIRALTIDHIAGHGIEHRRELYGGGGGTISSTAFYRYLIRNNFPPGYQVLCMNHQFVKKFRSNESGVGGFIRKV
jgi:hypothetical protein